MQKIALVAAVALGLAGCSSVPEAGTPERVAYEKEVRTEALTDQTEEGMDNLPDWCVSVPQEEHALYACGIGGSVDINISRTRAELEAKRQLAEKVAGRLSAQVKSFQESVGDGLDEQVNEQLTIVTKSVAADVELIGYSTKEVEIKAQGPKYMTYMLLEYPLGEVNKLVVEKVRQNTVLSTRLSAADAFAELEKEVEASR